MWYITSAVVWLCQNNFLRFFRIFIKIFADFQMAGEENCQGLRGPHIFVANHKNYFDPFLVGAGVIRKSNLAPIRVMTADEYLRVPILNLFLLSQGCFPAHYGQGLDLSLAWPREILRHGWCLGIFPEGGMFKRKGLGWPQKGAAVLALESKKPILPFAIKGSEMLTLRRIAYRRPKVTICIGKPFYLHEKTNDSIEGTKIIMETIKQLYDAV